MGTSHSKSPEINYRDFLNITLTHPLNRGETTVSQNLWQSSPALILMIRRPGCALCREEALDLTQSAAKIQDELGIRMVAVCHEKLGSEEFLSQYWSKGELWIDTERQFYAAIAGGKEKKMPMFRILTDSEVRKKYKASKKRVDGDHRGEGRIMGGLLIVGQGDKGIIYAHLETTVGDRMDKNKVLSVCESMMKEGAAAPQSSL